MIDSGGAEAIHGIEIYNFSHLCIQLMRCYWSIDMLKDAMGRHPETKEISGGIYTVLSVNRTKNYQLDLPFLLLLKTTGKYKHKRRRMRYLFTSMPDI